MVVCFFFQAEDGIRDSSVTGVQTCALPIWWRRGRRARYHWQRARHFDTARQDRKSVVKGKSVDLGGRRIIKKKKKRKRKKKQRYKKKKNQKRAKKKKRKKK